MKNIYNTCATLSKFVLVIMVVTLFTKCKKDDLPLEQVQKASILSKDLKKSLLLSVKGVTKNSYYLEDALPEGYVKDGSKDYTAIIQNVLNKYSDIVFPAFPLLVNDKGLNIESNTTIVFLEGSEIHLKPSSKQFYNILNIASADNVTLYSPVVIGDRYDHKGDEGEGGTGIGIRGSSNIAVYSPNVRECWGDGMYIGQVNNTGACKNITIKDAFLKRNRRDGISIISVAGLLMESPYAGYSDGTQPMCGINFEANNSDCVMKDIVITDALTLRNLGNGIQVGVRRMLGKGNRSIDISFINHHDILSGKNAFKTSCMSQTRNDDGLMKGSIKVINPVWEGTASGYPLTFATNQSGLNLFIESAKVIDTDGNYVTEDKYAEIFDAGVAGLGKLDLKLNRDK